MILLVGGSGTLGYAISQRLAAAAIPATVMSRNPDIHIDRFPSTIEFVQGDLRDKSSIENALKDKTTVVHAAHSMLGRGRNASRFVDDRGGRQLVDSAVAAGVKQFVYVSAWFPPRMASIPFFKAKQSVAAHLRLSGLPHIIVRPTAFMDVHAEQMIGRRIAANKKVIVFGPGTAKRNMVSADDVAETIVSLLQTNISDSKTVVIGGPQNLSTGDIIAAYELLLKKPAGIVHVPLAVASIACRLLRPFHPGIAQIMDITRQIEGYDDDFVVEANSVSAANESLERWAQRRLQVSANLEN